MHHNTTMIFQRLITAACMCCMLGVGSAIAAPFDDAMAAYNKNDYAQAIRLWKSLAAQGEASAQYNLGVMYSNGSGVTKDYQEAQKWYRLAAAQGDASAQYNLGAMYEFSQGVPKDNQEAVKWYRLAAAQGNAQAQSNLGLILYRQMADAALQLDARPVQAQPWQLKQPQQSANNKTQTTQPTPLPPKLVFNSSSPRADGFVELSGQVTSGARISEISIDNRGLEVLLTKDGSFKVTRFLPMGATTYRLSVVDEFGQKADAEVNVARKAPQLAEEKVAPLDPRKMRAKSNPDAVALIIGVGSYSDLPKADYAKEDANKFYDFANQALGVPANKIKLLTDAQASRIDLLKAMRSWMRAEVVGGKSDVYIFFAGHGLASADGAKTYLLPADGHRDLLDETSILRDDLIASAKGARTITMFLDTCYSGGTRGTEILLAGARPIAIVPDESGLPANVTLLAAATGSQLSSTYDAAHHGLFSYWLMKGLEGEADANRDKKITTGELHDYVSKRVGPIAQRRNRQQDPQLIGDSARVLVSY